MRRDKTIAFKLRKSGKSYQAISGSLGMSKSTLSTWFAKLPWSNGIKSELALKANKQAYKHINLLNKIRRKKRELWIRDIHESAKKNFKRLCKNPLFIAGTMLYWGEGDRNPKTSVVRVANKDAAMLRIFSCFLQNICFIPKEKIKLAMTLYPDLNEQKCQRFWSRYVGISKAQFTKTQRIQGKHPTKRLPNGICTIVVTSREIKENILIWINLFQKNL